MISFVEANKRVFVTKLFNFHDRASRSEMWWSFIGFWILGLVIVPAAMFYDTNNNSAFCTFSAVLILNIPFWSLTVRRLHDLGHGWYWLLLGLIPIVNLFILIEFYFGKGSAGLNRFDSNQAPLSSGGEDLSQGQAGSKADKSDLASSNSSEDSLLNTVTEKVSEIKDAVEKSSLDKEVIAEQNSTNNAYEKVANEEDADSADDEDVEEDTSESDDDDDNDNDNDNVNVVSSIFGFLNIFGGIKGLFGFISVFVAIVGGLYKAGFSYVGYLYGIGPSINETAFSEGRISLCFRQVYDMNKKQADLFGKAVHVAAFNKDNETSLELVDQDASLIRQLFNLTYSDNKMVNTVENAISNAPDDLLKVIPFEKKMELVKNAQSILNTLKKHKYYGSCANFNYANLYNVMLPGLPNLKYAGGKYKYTYYKDDPDKCTAEVINMLASSAMDGNYVVIKDAFANYSTYASKYKGPGFDSQLSMAVGVYPRLLSYILSNINDPKVLNLIQNEKNTAKGQCEIKILMNDILLKVPRSEQQLYVETIFSNDDY